MPKKTVKSPKKKITQKAKAKIAVKAAAPNKGTRRGFMWKVLEQKEQMQKERMSVIPQGEATNLNKAQGPQNGFARFNGPRRKAA